MSLIQRIYARLNELRYYQRRQLIAQTPRQSYSSPLRIVTAPTSSKPVPLFGQDPETMIGYSETRSSSPAPQGVREGVSKPEFENIQGSVKNWTPTPGIPKMVSHGTKEPSGPTDQVMSPKGKSMTSAWDGVVRNAKTSSNSPLSFRQKSQPTPADLHKKDLERADYDFSG